MQHNRILIKPENGKKYSSVLEEGDYIPYFVHNQKSIQNSAGKPNLFIITSSCDKSAFQKFTRININTYIVCNETSYNHSNIIDNSDICRLFPSDKYILTTPNLKIHKIYNNYEDINMSDIENIPKLSPPIVIVPNVISESLKNKLIAHYEKATKSVELKGSKNRRHAFTDIALTEMLDDKLSKSLFPELKKIFNIDITHRENYKICSYTEEDRGKFHAHRDSVHPFGHRRLAMSLILNDDYEGGGIIFPEYNDTVYKPEPLSAVIFPTPLFHQVLEVTGGTRYVIIAFLFGDEEAEYKKKFNSSLNKSDNISQYEITVVRDQRDIYVDDICPQRP